MKDVVRESEKKKRKKRKAKKNKERGKKRRTRASERPSELNFFGKEWFCPDVITVEEVKVGGKKKKRGRKREKNPYREKTNKVTTI